MNTSSAVTLEYMDGRRCEGRETRSHSQSGLVGGCVVGQPTAVSQALNHLDLKNKNTGTFIRNALHKFKIHISVERSLLNARIQCDRIHINLNNSKHFALSI